MSQRESVGFSVLERLQNKFSPSRNRIQFFLKILGFLLFGLFLIFAVAFAVLPLPGTVPVLMYHFVGTEQDAAKEKNYIGTESFKNQMEFLHRFGYRVISLDEYYEIKAGRRKPRGREIVLTFDDGDQTFATNAFPILKQYEFPVTLFLITNSIKYDGPYASMTQETLRHLLRHPWIGIGAHSRTHRQVSRLTQKELEEEIAGSKHELEELFGRPVNHYSYPGGDLDARAMEVARRAGYRLAFTTSYKRLKELKEGPYSHVRLKISRTSDNPIAFWSKLSGVYIFYKSARHALKSPVTHSTVPSSGHS